MDSSSFYPPHQAGQTSLQLLQRLGRDDEQAWQQFVSLYGPVVRYWIRRGGVARHDQRDVFQEIFVVIHRKAAEFEPHEGVAKFRAWLKTVTLSKISDYYRHQARRPLALGGTDAMIRMQEVPAGAARGEAIDRDPSLPDDDESLATRQALRIVSEEFQERTWRAFWRTAVDGCAASDVAGELGLSAVAVRKAKSRVLCRLREFLSTDEEVKSPPGAAADDDLAGQGT